MICLIVFLKDFKIGISKLKELISWESLGITLLDIGRGGVNSMILCLLEEE